MLKHGSIKQVPTYKREPVPDGPDQPGTPEQSNTLPSLCASFLHLPKGQEMGMG